MKKLICLIAFLLIGAQIGSAESIYFSPQFSTIDVGDPLQVDVMISGIKAPWLGGYDIDITFDPAIIGFTGIWWHDGFLGDYFTTSTYAGAYSTGVMNAAEISFLPVTAAPGDPSLESLQSGSDPFRLFTIFFSSALAPGVSPLSFSRVDLTDGNANWIILPAGGAQDGSITVQSAGMPEPGAVSLLLVFGVGSLAIFRRPKRR